MSKSVEIVLYLESNFWSAGYSYQLGAVWKIDEFPIDEDIEE